MSFAPGHISLTFAIWPDSDLLAMGSTGVGIVLPNHTSNKNRNRHFQA